MTLTIIALYDKVNGINIIIEEISPMKFTVTLLSLCLIIIPLCSIKNIQNFKVPIDLSIIDRVVFSVHSSFHRHHYRDQCIFNQVYS